MTDWDRETSAFRLSFAIWFRSLVVAKKRKISKPDVTSIYRLKLKRKSEKGEGERDRGRAGERGMISVSVRK